MINFRLIKRLWLFLAVAEEQHFGRAAKRLGMSQPPLTEQIQILEHELNFKLFERSRRGAQLTPIGVAILPAVKQFAEQLANLEFVVREAAAGKSHVLIIGAVEAAFADILPPLIVTIKRRHPEVSVTVKEINSADANFLLQSGIIDLAFARLENGHNAAIRLAPIKPDLLAVVLPKDHALAGKRKIRLQALADEDYVMCFRHGNPGYFDNIVAACVAAGFSPRIMHEVNSVSNQVAFVGCGQGIGLVPLSAKKFAPESVTIIPLQPALDIGTIVVAWNAERTKAVIESALLILGITKSDEKNPRN